MSKMLKLLEFVGKSDTAKTIKGEKNDAIKSMDAAIKAALPKAVKKRENQARAQNGEGSVNKLASMRFRRRRYTKTNSHYLDIGKPGLRVPLDKTGTVYSPPEIPRRRASAILRDDPAFIAMRKKRDEEQAKFERSMAEIKGPLQMDMEAFLAAPTTHSMPDEAVIAYINKLYADQEREKKIDEFTKKTQDRQKKAALRSWLQVRQAEKKIAEGKKANADKWKKLHEAVEKRNEEKKEEQRRAAAITKIQAAQRRKAAKAKVDEMRATADRDAERELAAWEEEAVDDPFSIPSEPTATYTTLLNNKFKDSLTGRPLLSVKRIRDNGDCLFEALVYFIRRVGAKGLHTLPGYPTEARTIVEEILDLVGRYGKDNEEGLNLQIAIMRDYLAKSVKKDWTKEQPSLNENPYMTFLDESAGGAGIFKDSDDYLTHMTSKNEDDAKSKLSERGYGYKPQGRFGGVPELLEFQRLFNTKVQIIKGQKINIGTPRETTELRFDGFDGLFKVNENDIFDTKVMTLIFYSHPTNAVPVEPAPHYELIELTGAGEALAKSREEDLSLLEELDETEEGKKSPAAPAISSEERNIGDCVQFTYPDGSVVRGIIIRDEEGIKIKGLYVGRDGKKILGSTPNAFTPDSLSQIEDWNPTSEDLEQFFNFPAEEEKLNKKLQRVNGKIDNMLNKYSTSAQASIKKHLTTIVKLRFTAKSRLRTEGREDEQVKKMTRQQFEYKNLVKKYIRTKEPGKDDKVYDNQFDELLKLWQARTNMRNYYLKMNEMKPMLERCVKKKGGKRKRKTKRKRRKRKKKKSTRRKR